MINKPQDIYSKHKHENPSIRASYIARMTDYTANHVGKILKANHCEPPPPVPEAGHAVQAERGAASNPKWFERAVEAYPVGLIAALDLLLEGETPRRPSTDLLNPLRVCLTTDREMQANTFVHDLN